MKTTLACLLVISAGTAFASDYPTNPGAMDELCEEIGGSRDASTPPKDRLWFSENCVCEEEIGCGYASSRRFAERRKVAGQADAKRREEELKALAERDAEDSEAGPVHLRHLRRVSPEARERRPGLRAGRGELRVRLLLGAPGRRGLRPGDRRAQEEPGGGGLQGCVAPYRVAQDHPVIRQPAAVFWRATAMIEPFCEVFFPFTL